MGGICLVDIARPMERTERIRARGNAVAFERTRAACGLPVSQKRVNHDVADEVNFFRRHTLAKEIVGR